MQSLVQHYFYTPWKWRIWHLQNQSNYWEVLTGPPHNSTYPSPLMGFCCLNVYNADINSKSFLPAKCVFIQEQRRAVIREGEECYGGKKKVGRGCFGEKWEFRATTASHRVSRWNSWLHGWDAFTLIVKRPLLTDLNSSRILFNKKNQVFHRSVIDVYKPQNMSMKEIET